MEHLPALLRKDRRPLRPDEPEKWDVLFNGDLLISRHHDPEHAACRALLARGLTGKVAFVHTNGMAGMTMDIEKGAGLTVSENEHHGPYFTQYQPFNRAGNAISKLAVSSPARAEPSDGEKYQPRQTLAGDGRAA